MQQNTAPGNSHTRTIELTGTAFENGRLEGELIAGRLNDLIHHAKHHLQEHQVTELKMRNRSERFATLLQNVASDWLEEASGLADGAGADFEDIMLLNCNPDILIRANRPSCSSFIRIEPERVLLGKIRDTRNRTQQFLVRKNASRLRCQIGKTIGHLGYGHAFSETAIAGACNTGGIIDYSGENPHFDDCHALRYIAECAQTLAEIPDIYDELIRKGAIGGSEYNRGAILLFADNNRGLLLESANNHFQTRVIDSHFLAVTNHFLLQEMQKLEINQPDENTNLRRNRLEVLLSQLEPGAPIQHYFSITRDRQNAPYSLCNDDTQHPWMTLSAQIHEINRAQPRTSKTWFCCGHPAHSVFLPWSLQNGKTFNHLAAGNFYAASDRIYQQYKGMSLHFWNLAEFERRATESYPNSNSSPENDELALADQAYQLLVCQSDGDGSLPPA
ncbi:hypothetical protein JXJ21_15270 [candidate division KSB1 bacterium]|nr:hypothetical protein [candidate division KSB1 bacterium]